VVLSGTVADDSHKMLAQDTVEGLPGVKRVDNRLEVSGERAEENSDTWILAKVKTSLWFHRSVSSLTHVDVKDGCVTLRGTASSLAEKDLTTEYARDVEGVKDVKNEMTVAKDRKDGSEKDAAASPEVIDDASINAQVRMALASHRSTSALQTRPVTENGVVTLSGEAENQAQKDLASKIARDIDGVKGVNNTMTVKV
jgi:hyperosmotically inducible periplasmic protein